MTMIICNKLIALLPNPRQEVFHTRRMAFRGIDPVPMWIVPDWFAVLLERVETPHEGKKQKLASLGALLGRE